MAEVRGAQLAGKTGGWDVERIERADLTGISRLEILAAISKGVEAGVPVDLLVKGLLNAGVQADNAGRLIDPTMAIGLAGRPCPTR